MPKYIYEKPHLDDRVALVLFSARAEVFVLNQIAQKDEDHSCKKVDHKSKVVEDDNIIDGDNTDHWMI